MIDLQKGSKVKYIGCSQSQIDFGGHDDPRYILQIGGIFTIEDMRVYNWFTRIKLKGIWGRFNSVCFEKIVE